MLNKNISKNAEKRKQGKISRIKGKIAENLACFLLICKGYRIISRNFSCGKGTGRGETDIIAAKANLIVFAEVKYRSCQENCSFAVPLSNKKRVTATAEYFLGKNPAFKDFGVRFDVILFSGLFFPEHIKDAWRAEWW
jgi:putative endonuclease